MGLDKIFLLCVFVHIQALPPQDFANVNVVFDRLAAFGRQTDLQSSRQIACVTVLSDNELHQNRLPNDDRMKCALNADGQTIHGEKIILNNYMYGQDGLVQKMKDANSDNSPYNVILYSYYIPCSLVNHDCASLLKNDKNDKGYTLYVGFSTFFSSFDSPQNKMRTIKNLEDSFKTLTSLSGIYVFQTVRYYRGQTPQKYYHPITSISQYFDENLFNQIMQYPLPFCCTTTFTEEVVKVSMNAMLLNCRQHFGSPGTEHVMARDCFVNWAKGELGTNTTCRYCWNKTNYATTASYKYFAERAIKDAWKISKEFREIDVGDARRTLENHQYRCQNHDQVQLNVESFCTKKS